MNLTLADAISTFGVDVLEHHDREVDIPIVTGAQRQGDVIVLPMRKGQVAGLEPIPADGIPVVRGENGGNTHLLIGGGMYAPRVDGQDLGTLVVGAGETAFLTHPEHGYSGIGPGTYRVRRQREQAEEIRTVAD